MSEAVPLTSFAEIFRVFSKLGLTSFGGPIAHLGYFRDEFVGRRRWLTEAAYADLVALCQVLPGPASSQVGAAVGLLRGGLPGAVVAWIGFTLPSALILMLFGLGVVRFASVLDSGFIHGLKVVAVAIVAQALWNMGRNLCPDRRRAAVALAAAFAMTLVPSVTAHIVVIVGGGLLGWTLLRQTSAPLPAHAPIVMAWGRRRGATALAVFGALLFAGPLVAAAAGGLHGAIAQFDRFYRAGALVFGGGHVVLPLLEAELVPSGVVSHDLFLAGYGAAQAVPGPLFTFAAYLGTVAKAAPTGAVGAALCLVAIFLPGFLLVIGVLPFWESLRRHIAMRSVLQGVNAAVVGILLAAFYQPVWTSAIRQPVDFLCAAAALALLVVWKLPPWLVVIASAATMTLLA